jgi:hypothetical protein
MQINIYKNVLKRIIGCMHIQGGHIYIFICILFRGLTVTAGVSVYSGGMNIRNSGVTIQNGGLSVRGGVSITTLGRGVYMI